MPDESLYKALVQYGEGDMYPLHMPGHKRRIKEILASPYAIDITEIDGFDNLHHAQDILKAAQERAARVWGARRTWYLVGGSSAGILAGIAACAKGRILLARNCHKSVYFGAAINGADTIFVYPRPLALGEDERGLVSIPALKADGHPFPVNGRIHPEDVAAAMDQNPGISLVVVTSPTYDGVVSDIAGIAEVVHSRGALLMVDEAHGAHFGFHFAFPESAVKLGADIVVQSLHKTLPALTQCALLHLCSSRIDEETISKMTEVYQTSSPSYVLMASMDQCVREMEQNGIRLLQVLAENLNRFYRQIIQASYIQTVHADDPSRILVTAGRYMSGLELEHLLRNEYHLETEMTTPSYVLCLMSVGDTREGFERLSRALLEIDQKIREKETEKEHTRDVPEKEAKGNIYRIFDEKPFTAMPLAKAWRAPSRSLPLPACAGEISAEFVYLYPPGIPLVIPGERLSENTIRYVETCLSEGYCLQGMADQSGRQLRVI